MQIKIRPLDLKLKRDFIIAGGHAESKNNFLVICEGIGLGEASGSVAYGPEPGEIERDLVSLAKKLKDVGFQSGGIVIREMAEEFSKPALCGISTAWYDFCAKRDNQSLAGLFGLPEAVQMETSVTVSIGDSSEIENWVKLGYRNIKVKLGRDFKSALNVINRYQDVKFRIDANGSWKESDAQIFIEQISGSNVKLIEQPFSAGDVENWKRLKESRNIPIFMDESIVSADDVMRVASYVDGVNIKIQKSGSIEVACDALKRARLLGLKTMIGCMIESSVGIATAMQLSSLADYIDLDGQLLLDDERFVGLEYNDGLVKVTGKIGHGVSQA